MSVKLVDMRTGWIVVVIKTGECLAHIAKPGADGWTAALNVCAFNGWRVTV